MGDGAQIGSATPDAADRLDRQIRAAAKGTDGLWSDGSARRCIVTDVARA